MESAIKLILFATCLLPAPMALAEEDNHFEIIEQSSQIVGDSDPMTSGAREKWKHACEEWKVETRDLNKSEQIVALSCNQPSCSWVDNGGTVCSSTGTYKLKTRGTLNPPTSVAASGDNFNQLPPLGGFGSVSSTPTGGFGSPIYQQPPPQQVVVQTEYVEREPDPIPGLLWIAGFWAWSHHQRYWHPGHWEHDHHSHHGGHDWPHYSHRRWGHWPYQARW